MTPRPGGGELKPGRTARRIAGTTIRACGEMDCRGARIERAEAAYSIGELTDRRIGGRSHDQIVTTIRPAAGYGPVAGPRNRFPSIPADRSFWEMVSRLAPIFKKREVAPCDEQILSAQ